MVVENLRIDVTPGGVPLVIHVSQYDAGLRQFNFTPYDKGVQMAKISGATVTMEATKPDGYAVQHPCTYNNDGTITYVLQEQLAAVEGQVWSKLTWRNSSGDILGAKAIIWAVDTAGIEDGAVVSESDLPLIEQAAEFASEYEEKVADMIAEMQIVPGQVVIDGTLTVPGAAADAKVVGKRFRRDETQLWTPDIKTALLACFQNVAWSNDQGQTYYDALETALYANDYPRLEVVYTAGITPVYTDDSLDTVKQYLTATFYEDMEDTGTVVPSADYTLTGTLQAGTSTLYASYSGVTAVVTIPGVVDFYNIWEWYSGSTGANALYRLPTNAAEKTIDGVRRGFLYASQGVASNNRRSFCVNKGKQVMIDSNGNPTTFYPVPVPKTATKLTATISPATQQFAAYVMKYEGQVRQDGYNYLWVAPSQISWHIETDVVEFSASENLFVGFNCRKNASNAQYAEGEEPTMHLLFE